MIDTKVERDTCKETVAGGIDVVRAGGAPISAVLTLLGQITHLLCGLLDAIQLDDPRVNERMRQIAEKYAQRQQMDGEVIKKTGEVVPRETA